MKHQPRKETESSYFFTLLPLTMPILDAEAVVVMIDDRNFGPNE